MICRYKIKFISDIEQKIRKLLVNIAVAPFVGVWIEIIGDSGKKTQDIVAHFVGKLQHHQHFDNPLNHQQNQY